MGTGEVDAWFSCVACLPETKDRDFHILTGVAYAPLSKHVNSALSSLQIRYQRSGDETHFFN